MSTALFVVASALCGLANSIGWLVAWRAVQGVGAGGLMVTAMALIADIIPLRERGKYQGALGAVFGVAVHLRLRHGQPTGMDDIARFAMVPSGVLLPAFQDAQAAGYLAGDPAAWDLTPQGRREWDTFSTGLKDWLTRHLDVKGADDARQLDAALGRLTGRFLDEETIARVRVQVPELSAAPAG